MRPAMKLLSVLLLLFPTPAAMGDVFAMPSGQTSLLFVPVNDANNAPDSNGLGSVPYDFNMGEFLVTSAQYTQFLNAVAKTDQFGCYNVEMGPTHSNAGITQSGSAGSYTYSVLAADDNFPVTFVNWGDAARFCNWLTNGQPTSGVEDSSTTEDGSYALNGAVTDAALLAVTRPPTAEYVLPSFNEFYKSAFYKGGSLNAGYWLYPTQSDTAPSNVLSATGKNNANFDNSNLTPVGLFADSPSSYGTYDQGGDASEWTEGITDGSVFEILGGGFSGSASLFEAGSLGTANPTIATGFLGFRVAEVPEPTAVATLALAVGLLSRKKR